jgi:hypothetical protein
MSTSTGCLAANFHTAARTEYLAQYVFSAFGASQLVARTEDFGLDFYCTLGHRIGQRLHVENNYNVQVKSTTKSFSYEDAKSVEWVAALNEPLLFCVINKSCHEISIYSGFNLTLLAGQALSKININFGDSYKNHFKLDMADVTMGNPIAKFKITDLEDPEIVKNISLILKFWIECDQDNILRKNLGLTSFYYPLDYETNKVPTHTEGQLSGDFLATFKNQDTLDKHMKAFYRSLATQVVFAAHACQKEYLIHLSRAAVDTMEKDDHFDDLDSSNRKNDIISLAAQIKSAHRYLDIEQPIFIKEQFADIIVENVIVKDK